MQYHSLIVSCILFNCAIAKTTQNGHTTLVDLISSEAKKLAQFPQMGAMPVQIPDGIPAMSGIPGFPAGNSGMNVPFPLPAGIPGMPAAGIPGSMPPTGYPGMPAQVPQGTNVATGNATTA